MLASEASTSGASECKVVEVTSLPGSVPDPGALATEVVVEEGGMMIDESTLNRTKTDKGK